MSIRYLISHFVCGGLHCPGRNRNRSGDQSTSRLVITSHGESLRGVTRNYPSRGSVAKSQQNQSSQPCSSGATESASNELYRTVGQNLSNPEVCVYCISIYIAAPRPDMPCLVYRRSLPALLHCMAPIKTPVPDQLFTFSLWRGS